MRAGLVTVGWTDRQVFYAGQEEGAALHRPYSTTIPLPIPIPIPPDPRLSPGPDVSLRRGRNGQVRDRRRRKKKKKGIQVVGGERVESRDGTEEGE